MRAKTKHWRSLAALLAAAVLTLCSCAGRSSPESAKKPSYRLFYLNQEATAVITKDYVPYTRFASESAGATDTEGSTEVSSDITAKEASEMETEDYISDMLRQLANSDEVEYSAPLKGISILSRNLVDKNLTLNLSEGYEKLGNIQQILVRAAVVLTLTQLDDVDTVTILSGGQPVYDANGNEVGAQSADDFISSSGSEIQNYQRERLHLYFANRDGDKLIDTYRNVVYNSNISTERVDEGHRRHHKRRRLLCQPRRYLSHGSLQRDLPGRGLLHRQRPDPALHGGPGAVFHQRRHECLLHGEPEVPEPLHLQFRSRRLRRHRERIGE